MTDCDNMSVEAFSAALAQGECTAEELVSRCFDRMREKEPTVGAFLTVDEEGAMRAAQESDRRRKEGKPLSHMDGIPFAVKDNFCTAGIRTTCASRMLEHYIPPYDATAVAKLKQAGCVLLGKLNMDEFAMGSSTQHSALGVTRNPLDAERVPGGSSGGSAAAVAAGEIPFTLGSDTGGSVRQPAAFCGVMGFKPTYGAISRYGMVAFAPSLDCVGIVTSTAKDAASVLQVIAGRDPMDATSLSYPCPDLTEQIDRGAKGLRIAVVPDAGMGHLPDAARRSVEASVRALRDAGAVLYEAKLPSPEQALSAYCVISAVEAASNLARFDGIRYGIGAPDAATPEEIRAISRGNGFGREVKLRILMGTAMLTGDFRKRYYLPACHIREQVRQMLYGLFAHCDLILKPTTPCGAFRFDEEISALQMREMDLCTVYASLAGIPALSVPVGKDENGMPLGIQLMAPDLREDLILRAANALEEGTHE